MENSFDTTPLLFWINLNSSFVFESKFSVGEVAEWSNAAVSKTVVQGNLDREFKSHPLRQIFGKNLKDLI